MIKVLIVDDSAVVRANLAHILTSDPGINVIGTATDGKSALDFMQRQKPDVITMDINMPGIDGFETTRQIMESFPVPIIVVSATWKPAQQIKSFEALEAGALTCMVQPAGIGHPDYANNAAQIISTVKQISKVKVLQRKRRTPSAPAYAPATIPANPPKIRIVAIGASTGGPPIILRFLKQLPKDFPVPLLIVQHISKGFTDGLVEWLNDSSLLPVHLAGNGEIVKNGHVYVAPEDLQMGITGEGRIILTADSPEHYLRPSVSHLFRAVATAYPHAAAGILLTGMGKDGAAEMKLIKDAGGITFAQDKNSSIVHGMPGEAIRLGAANHILPPEAIASTLTALLEKQTAP